MAKRPADGYTMLVSLASVHICATTTRSVMPFDAIADFTHMAMLMARLEDLQTLLKSFKGK